MFKPERLHPGLAYLSSISAPVPVINTQSRVYPYTSGARHWVALLKPINSSVVKVPTDSLLCPLNQFMNVIIKLIYNQR